MESGEGFGRIEVGGFVLVKPGEVVDMIRSRKDVSRSGGPAERNHAKTSLSWKTEASFSIEYSLSVKSLLSRISHLIISCW